jgi:hypothetical protein
LIISVNISTKKLCGGSVTESEIDASGSKIGLNGEGESCVVRDSGGVGGESDNLNFLHR